MMLSLVAVTCSILASPDSSYLLRAAEALESARVEVATMQAPAEALADRITQGGQLYAGGNPALISEVSGRAGGLMMIGGLGETAPSAKDAVIFFADAGHPLPETVRDSGAAVVVLSDAVPPKPMLYIVTHPKEHGLSPTLDAAIYAWLFTGELVAACTRLGKMPVLFESIGLYGGIPRQQNFQGKGILWHEQHHVPALAPGALAMEYIDRVSAMLRRVNKEHGSDLARVGNIAAKVKRNGHRAIMYSMGHLFPDEIEKTEIGKFFESMVWNAGFSYFAPPEHDLKAGDCAIHIGYQHPPLSLLDTARKTGATAVYVSVFKDRDYSTGEGIIYIDPMWPFADACVAIPGYDIPALAASGVVNGAIAWEIFCSAM